MKRAKDLLQNHVCNLAPNVTDSQSTSYQWVYGLKYKKRNERGKQCSEWIVLRVEL